MEERFENFTILIAKISRAIRKIKSEEMEEFALKSPHVSCLYYLYKNDGSLTAKELCDICDEDKASISRSLEYLEETGYIECNSKTEKRYKSPLILTDKGNKMGEYISNKISKNVDMASAGLSDKDREVLYKSLFIISDNLQKICDNYGD